MKKNNLSGSNSDSIDDSWKEINLALTRTVSKLHTQDIMPISKDVRKTSLVLKENNTEVITLPRDIKLENGDIVKILDDQPFDHGGQGNLFRVKYGRKTCILKKYTSKSALTDPDFRRNLGRLTGLKIDGFVLPISLTSESEGFGYVMDYVPTEKGYVLLSDILYKEGVSYMSDKAEFMTPSVIAKRFADLHSKGECFKDINDNNIFVNTKRPDVMICDCDNIAPGSYHSIVRGKPGYIAPEVVLKRNAPDVYSDRFSLAVLFFRIFVGADPLLGDANIGSLDDECTKKIYGTNPVFIFDKDNHSNQCTDSDVINRWESIDPEIKQCFYETFSDGIRDREKRTTAEKWFEILTKWGQYQSKTNDESGYISTKHKAKKRYQPIFFIIDNSSSMEKHDRLAKVQEAFNKIFADQLMTISDTVVSIDIMTFSKDGKWIFNELTDVERLSSVSLRIGEEYTNFNRACETLDERLNKDRVLNNEKHPNVPVIILISDGWDSPSKYREEMFKLLADNRWYKKAHKLAIGISIPEKRRNMLLDFVGGDYRFVRNIDDGVDLCEYIKAVTMTITQTATQEDYESVSAKIADIVI